MRYTVISIKTEPFQIKQLKRFLKTDVNIKTDAKI